MSAASDFEKWLKHNAAQASPIERTMCYAAYMAGRRSDALERARKRKAAERRARRERLTQPK